MDYKLNDKVKTDQDYWVRIVEVINWNNHTIRFENGFELTNITKRALGSGNIRYPFHPTVHGVGYLGVGKHISTKKNIDTYNALNPAYKVWQAMLGRCYCPIVQKRQPNNRNLTVCPKWLNYQNFAKWFDKNNIEGFDFSQNILNPQSTVFSPDTCCFIPNEIRNSLSFVKRQKHNLPMGVMPNKKGFSAGLHIKGEKHLHLGCYSTPNKAFAQYRHAKQRHIRNLAKQWKKRLPIKTYTALMQYRVPKYQQ